MRGYTASPHGHPGMLKERGLRDEIGREMMYFAESWIDRGHVLGNC